MAVKETILAALQKGDVWDRTFRESVYRQVFAALERSVKTNTELSADDVYRRREQVVTIIAEIENEFAASMQNEEPPPADYSRSFAPSDGEGIGAQDIDFVPSVSRDERLTPGVRHTASRHDTEALLLREGRRDQRKRKRRNPWIRLIVWLVVLGLLVLGGLWIWGQATEAVRTRGASIEEIIGSSREMGSEAFLPSREDSEWIDVFTPSDTSTVRAGSGASAGINEDDEGEFLSIGGQGQSEIVFSIGQEALEQFAGRTVMFSVSARAQEDETQITVTCDFGMSGQCNRTRYVVGPTITDYLFEVDLTNGMPAGGTVSIIPDIEGSNRMLDVFSIKVTANE